ncbi:MAG: NifB/NifX family molybdenum-iron cluster-binding protein [Candidatus Cloacimonas sp.]|jgi:predicted Fe-Mo cluster-binding NifX family protein|nr:NifB/NifX family molybdenum-iron cluster-binding protein [Candidatus Cloacimonas sp.]
MKIAFTAKGTGWDSAIDPRLGRTEYILLYDEDKDTLSAIDNRDIEGVAHGAGTKTAQLLYEMNPDILITGNGPGNNAASVLKQTSMKIYVGAGDMTAKSAYDAYKKNELKEF